MQASAQVVAVEWTFNFQPKRKSADFNNRVCELCQACTRNAGKLELMTTNDGGCVVCSGVEVTVVQLQKSDRSRSDVMGRSVIDTCSPLGQ